MTLLFDNLVYKVPILWSKMTDQNIKGKLFLLHNMNITLRVQDLETFAHEC